MSSQHIEQSGHTEPSGALGAERAADPLRRRRWGQPRPLSIIWLTAVWMMLWGSFDLLGIVGGVIIALIATVLLPMPPLDLQMKLRPWALVVLVAVFVKDLVLASWDIILMLLRGRIPTGAVIRVRLRSHSDFFLVTTAGLVSLVPGTVVVDAHRLTGTLYLHVLDVKDENDLQIAHDNALAQEERLLRAFATNAMLVDSGYLPGARTSAGRVDARTGELLDGRSAS